MRRITWFFFLLSFVPATLAAQEVPKVEIFGGYSNFRIPTGINLSRIEDLPGVITITTDKASLNGWNLSVTGNINRWLGVEGDFGGYRGTVETQTGIIHLPPSISNGTRRVRIHSYMLGPRLSYRGDKRITPFAHALFGIVGMVLVETPPLVGGSRYPFGLALGGGFDINVARHMAIRAIQADYVRSRFGFTAENNLRLSFGAVIRF
ncbi:MAG: porin family protein [Acidobacteriia bacterium]|nr:porin family protein [Terriglobia bacterium]